MTAAELRLHIAVSRRLRDSGGRPIRLSLGAIAREENLNRRQARRAFRSLADAGLLEITYQGQREAGGVVVGRGR